jgi:hypothetical protein
MKNGCHRRKKGGGGEREICYSCMIENINKVVPAILNNQIHVINVKSSLFSIYTRVCAHIYVYIHRYRLGSSHTWCSFYQY